MMDEESLSWKLKTLIWALSGGIIVSFFFSSNFLAWATSFNPGGSVLLISPIMIGLLLGIVTWEADAIQTIISSFILTAVATIGVIMTLMSPMLFGVAWTPDAYYIYIAQNAMISIILILPLSLLGAMVGRLFAENTIMSVTYRSDRDKLRNETEEWYQMLEEKLDEKKESYEKILREREEAAEFEESSDDITDSSQI